MIRQSKQVGRSRLNGLLPMVALLLSPAVLHAQTNRLDFSDTTEISAGAPGLKMTIFGLFPINAGIQTPMCFFTVPGTSGKPLIPLKSDASSSTLVELQIPVGSIQEIPASAFDGGVFNATAYATANASDTCDGTFDSKYTNTLQIPIQEPAVLGTDLDTLTARNTNLSGNPAPREIYLQGTDFVPGEATATFSGSGFSPFAGVVTVVSPISARVNVPANLPAGAKFVALTYCTHTATADYCASPVNYPIQQLAINPGTLTATPSPTTPTTPTSLQAVFGSTDGFGVPSGLVTFTDGTTTLDSAPLKFTSGQFVATNPASAAPVEFEGSPQSILADLNQDGLQDVILYAPNTVQIYYAADNLGGLGFAGSGFGFTGVAFALDNDFCSSVVSVTTGDFNGDGYPDIAMLCVNPAGSADNVLVYLNQKDGTFGREAAIFPAPPAHLIAAADFDKDGNTDILLVGPDGNTDPNGTPLTGFNIYPGDGFGDFGNSTPVDVPLGDGLQVAALDFNNDGFPDIALLYHNFSSDFSTSPIEVFQNDGKGNFPATPTYTKSLGTSGATTQFFTPTLPGSQYPNLVAINKGINPYIAVVFNNQTPTIGFSNTVYTTPVPGLQTATMGDFNGDGFQDVAVYDGTNISVYNAGPTGQYNLPIDSFTEQLPTVNLLVGSSDANGDGYSDPIAFLTPSDGPRLVQQYITSGTATATLPGLTFAAGSHSLTATTPGTPTLAPGTATATLVSNGPTQIPVSNAVLTTSPASPTTYAPSNPVTLTAEVDSSNPPAPTGQISFFNAQTNTLLGTANLTATSSTQSSASLLIGTLTAGGYTFSATYPGDTTYLPTTLPSVTFLVNKATPLVGFVPNPATITFGTALSAAQLDATATLSGSAVAGSFVYTNASGTVVDTTTVLPGGSNNITATFTPSDTTDYKTPAGVTSTITVNKATPVVTFVPNPATLASGAPLTAAQLDATATFGGSAVAGSFVYTNAGGTVVTVGTVLPAGANVITASFTPSNTTNFNVPAGVAATITLNAATTTLTFVPNPSTITFGTALSAAQLDATATSGGSPVAGTFVYTNASGAVVNTTTILPAGSNAITVNFTPSDTTSFTTPTAVTTAITVTKATPTVSWTTPAAIPFGTALSGTQLDATASFNGNPVAGTFSYNPAAGTVLTAGTHTLGVTFTPTDGADFNVATGSTSISVGQATPTITWATPAAISYGTALSATQLNATATFNGTAVAGTFSYNPASGTVLTAGTHTLGVTFTPTDTTDFTTATGSVSITVSQSTPTITWATPAAISFGTALSATQLNATATFNGTAVAGAFSYNPAAGTVLAAGTHTLGVTFTPTDTTDFAVATGSVNITVGQSTPTITWATPAAISYGTALSGTQLNATATFNGTAVAGTFSYNPTAGTILTAGLHTLGVTFTPTDGADFTTATGSVNITVGQSTPIITWATPAAISYGTALSATQLNATAAFNGTAVAGTFSYNPVSGTVLTAGTHTLGVTFTPTDTTDFTVATGSVSITVGQSTPTITWATPAAISYGTALSATQLNATATFNGTAVAGTFSYNPAAGTVLTAGTHSLGVTFTPTDTTDFATATGSVSITVGQSTPTITWATPAAISYGTALSGTQLNATATYNGTAVAGTFSYNPAAGAVLTAGTHTLAVTFTPTDGTDFTVATGSVSITVGQSIPTITWATPAAISYGTALSGTQLNAIATFNGTAVAGTFSYNPAAGTVLTAGSHTLGVTFTPTDTTDFTVATGSVSITVGQSTPTITWATPAAISYGTALSGTQLNAAATFSGTAVAGTFTYNPAAGTVLTAGTHTLGVTFTPTDTTDFTVATGSVNITVGQSTPIITWATPAAISYGTALSATQLNATASFNGTAVAGTFSYNPASGTVLTAGTHTLGVTFTPTDTTDFAVATGSVNITVGQSTPIITWATPAAISYGTALSATQLNAAATFNGTAVAGTFSYNPVSGTVLSAGTHSLGVTFTPTDTTDFAVATGSTSIAVGQDTPVITWTPPAAITLGTPLGAAQLNASATGVGGTALAGTFAYLPAAGAVLPVGANSLGVSFTPTDTVDYKTATASVPLTVNPAVTTTTITPSANPAQFGQLVTFTLGVTSAYTGASITGPVSVFDGQTLLGTVQLPNVTVSTSTLSAGAHNITAVYGGSTNFGGSTSAVLTETISSATTTITWPQPASVPYGTKLSATQLNATVSTAFAQTVPGTFTYTPAAGALLTAGSQTLSVLFTPTDTASFKTATATVTLVVTKVAPTLNWATPANITAGTPLSATQLNATATDIGGNPLPGVFTYTPASGAILAPGATTLSAAFAPTDTVDYTTANISVPLNVDPAVASIAVTSTANPSQFGQPVTFNVSITSAYTATPISGTVTISDGKTVLGTPTLTNGAASFAISTLTAGAHSITASFAGNSTFAAATSPALAQTVNLATTIITWPTPAGISYGTPLSATQLNATVATAYAATVPGTFVYTPAAGTLLTAGTQTLSVAFTPTDTVNFKPATGSVTIGVGKTAPTITWPTPADLVAGTLLSATQLDATATGISGALPGTFAYTPALGTVLTAGTQNLSVTFTPTDVTDYTTATVSVPLNVIGLALTSLSTGSVKLGDPALNLTVTGTGFLPNSVVYVGATALTTTFVNRTTLTVTIPASNFLTVQILQITVNDPTQAQTSNALALLVGAPPATITVNGPSTVAPAAQPNLTFAVTPYAVPITATLTLTFTPAPGLTMDGTILFPNGTTTTTFTIPANTTTIPAVQFQSGSVAGTITIALKLTAGGVDVTPTPAPTLVITSPPAAPGVAGVTLDRTGDTLTVTIQGYSNTRDIQQIHFHFVAAPGQSLATSDLVIDGSALFGAWYANPASPTYGSTFHYIQVFNLDQAATVVGQVQVTLINSQGNSQTVSAQ